MKGRKQSAWSKILTEFLIYHLNQVPACFFLIGVQLLYTAMSASALQQNESAILVHISSLF